MSENLELVRSIYAGWERGDWSSADWADPGIEYTVVAFGPADGTSRGLDSMASAFRAWLSAWADWKLMAEGFTALDEERVLVRFHFTGRGKASSVDVGRLRTEGATLFHVFRGRVTRIIQYGELDRALADLGMEE